MGFGREGAGITRNDGLVMHLLKLGGCMKGVFYC